MNNQAASTHLDLATHYSDQYQRLLHTGFVNHLLDESHHFFSGTLPDELRFDEPGFETLWNQRPESYHRILQYGRLVDTPRRQQAYGHDYHYTGQVNKALEVPPLLLPILKWCQSNLDARLNGILINWYDSKLGHYIGAHRDSIKNLVPNSPIVTISCGAERTFRLTPHDRTKKESLDFSASDGRVFVMPFETNRTWKHQVRKGKYGRRISITLRAFWTTVVS